MNRDAVTISEQTQPASIQALHRVVDLCQMELLKFVAKLPNGKAELVAVEDTKAPGVYMRRRVFGGRTEYSFGQRYSDGFWSPLYGYQVYRLFEFMLPDLELFPSGNDR